MLTKMKGKVAKFAKMNLHLSMQICELFNEIRIAWAQELRPQMVFDIWKNEIKRSTFGKTLQLLCRLRRDYVLRPF